MTKKTDSLLFKFAIMFFCFILITIILSSVTAYINQRNIYKAQCEDSLVNIAQHLKMLVESEGRLFLDFQRYFIAHKDDILVPIDYDGNWQPLWYNFVRLFREKHPDKILGLDIHFNDLDPSVQRAYALYMHGKWLNIFETTPKNFNIHYAYYLVPSEKPLYMYWMIDAVREVKVVNNKNYIDLCTEVEEPLEKHQKMWEAWTTGTRIKGYDKYDNKFGKTFAYYIAVKYEGKNIGLVGTEIDIYDVDNAILKNTLIQSACIGTILALCACVLLFIIYKKYIKKIVKLQVNVRAYAQNKDAKITKSIEDNATGADEISTLSIQISTMILELENYMQSLTETTEALDAEKERAAAMNDLAHKDALTGIRNKTAYDKEIKRLAWAIEDKTAKFGIAMIDLNFLKRINDTFGHEQGNITIKKLCHIVCSIFKHSPVYRIGGDEFVVILENEDLDNINYLLELFDSTIKATEHDTSLEQWERVSAAIGVAFYDPIRDSSVDNVFKRADRAMYANKKAMKAIRET